MPRSTLESKIRTLKIDRNRFSLALRVHMPVAQLIALSLPRNVPVSPVIVCCPLCCDSTRRFISLAPSYCSNVLSNFKSFQFSLNALRGDH